MGLLDKLWDDVLAGPQPEHGLGRLRRKPKLPDGMRDTVDAAQRMVHRRRSSEFFSQQEEVRHRRRSSEFFSQQEEVPRVTRIITIAKPPPLLVDSLDPDRIGSAPSTPGAASTPTSSSFVGSPSVFDLERYFPRASSVPSSPAMASSGGRERENVQTLLFHSGSNEVVKNSDSENVQTSSFHIGSNEVVKKSDSEKLDKQAPSSSTVYDWVVLSALDR